MCRVSPGSPTEAQLLLVTACTFWGPQSMGLAREGLEGLGGVRLPGENGRAQWAHTPPGPLSRGARGAEDETVRKGGRGGLHLYLSRVCVQGIPGQTLCPKDTPELSLQPPKEALPLWAQQEAGAARELQTQHVTADAA